MAAIQDALGGEVGRTVCGTVGRTTPAFGPDIGPDSERDKSGTGTRRFSISAGLSGVGLCAPLHIREVYLHFVQTYLKEKKEGKILLTSFVGERACARSSFTSLRSRKNPKSSSALKIHLDETSPAPETSAPDTSSIPTPALL